MQSTIKLQGYIPIKNSNGKYMHANTQHSARMYACANAIVIPKGEHVHVRTRKGDYTLVRHHTQNYYYGSCGIYKVHIILRSLLGRIIWWDVLSKEDRDQMKLDVANTMSNIQNDDGVVPEYAPSDNPKSHSDIRVINDISKWVHPVHFGKAYYAPRNNEHRLTLVHGSIRNLKKAYAYYIGDKNQERNLDILKAALDKYNEVVFATYPKHRNKKISIATDPGHILESIEIEKPDSQG